MIFQHIRMETSLPLKEKKGEIFSRYQNCSPFARVLQLFRNTISASFSDTRTTGPLRCLLSHGSSLLPPEKASKGSRATARLRCTLGRMTLQTTGTFHPRAWGMNTLMITNKLWLKSHLWWIGHFMGHAGQAFRPYLVSLSIRHRGGYHTREISHHVAASAAGGEWMGQGGALHTHTEPSFLQSFLKCLLRSPGASRRYQGKVAPSWIRIERANGGHPEVLLGSRHD